MTVIRLLDDERDKEWTKFIFDLCGLNYETVRGERLTQKILDAHMNTIVREIFKYMGDYEYIDECLIGFQILGIFILETGAHLPDIVKYTILFSATWEYDKRRGWSELLEEERKENLKKFRDAILNHKLGQKTKITF